MPEISEDDLLRLYTLYTDQEVIEYLKENNIKVLLNTGGECEL